MHYRLPILFFILIWIAFVTMPAYCDEKHEFVEKLEAGSINWSRWVVQTRGVGQPNEKDKNNKTEEALTAAKQKAIHKILEVVKRIRIDSKSVVSDYADESDIVLSKIEGLIKDADVVKQNYLSDGTVEVIMEMSLLGGFSQLILPQTIKQIGSIKTMASTQGKHSPFTGLVVDARKIGARPAMTVRIVDENQKEVYGSAFVSRESAVQHGIGGYTTDMAFAQSNQRVTNKPLIVKGLRTIGTGSPVIVISNADASKLRSSSEHLSFLKKCRVMIVLDR
ncbi:MAG: hypothetical protein ACE5DO_14400 [Desulfobacterales bacterium]